MNPGCIPIRLSLRDLCVAALMEAAESIEMARDQGVFGDALGLPIGGDVPAYSRGWLVSLGASGNPGGCRERGR